MESIEQTMKTIRNIKRRGKTLDGYYILYIINIEEVEMLAEKGFAIIHQSFENTVGSGLCYIKIELTDKAEQLYMLDTL